MLRPLYFFQFALLALTMSMVGCELLEEPDQPVLKSEIKIEDTQGYLPGNFKWLDNDRIIVTSNDQYKPYPKVGAYLSKKLVVWDTAKNTLRTLPYSDVGGLCLINQNIRFFTRQIASDPSGVRTEIETRQYYEGNLNNFMPINLIEPIELTSCESKQDRTFLPAWAQSIPEINIIRLKPEHGFIWIERDAKKLLEKPKGLWLYPPYADKNQGIDVSEVIKNYSINVGVNLDVKFFSHQQAYLYPAFDGIWWIYPNGKIESNKLITESLHKFGRKSFSEEAMTKAGMLFGTNDYVNVHLDKDDGIFLRDESLNLKRLVKGRIGNVDLR